MSLVEIPDPPGYKVVAYGKPQKGQLFCPVEGRVAEAAFTYQNTNMPIVERIVVWRDATVADLERAPVKCRAKNDENGPWIEKVLLGYRAISRPHVWVTDDMSLHTTVQVVDETSPAK